MLSKSADFNVILHYLEDRNIQPNDLSDYIRHQIYLKSQDKPANHIVKISQSDFGLSDDAENVIYANAFGGPDLSILKWFTSTDQQKAKLLFRSNLTKMLNEIEQLQKKYPDYPIVFGEQCLNKAKLVDLNSYNKCIKLLRMQYKDKYDALNNSISDINKIQDNAAKQAAISKYKDEINALIQKIKCSIG